MSFQLTPPPVPEPNIPDAQINWELKQKFNTSGINTNFFAPYGQLITDFEKDVNCIFLNEIKTFEINHRKFFRYYMDSTALEEFEASTNFLLRHPRFNFGSLCFNHTELHANSSIFILADIKLPQLDLQSTLAHDLERISNSYTIIYQKYPRSGHVIIRIFIPKGSNFKIRRLEGLSAAAKAYYFGG